MQRNPQADMGRRSSGSELLGWPSELEPPPLPAVTRRRARRTDDRGDCGPRKVGREFAVRKSALVKEATLKALVAADAVGVRAMVLYGKDQELADSYKRFDFEGSPTDDLHLFLSIAELRKAEGSV